MPNHTYQILDTDEDAIPKLLERIDWCTREIDDMQAQNRAYAAEHWDRWQRMTDSQRDEASPWSKDDIRRRREQRGRAQYRVALLNGEIHGDVADAKRREIERKKERLARAKYEDLCRALAGVTTRRKLVGQDLSALRNPRSVRVIREHRGLTMPTLEAMYKDLVAETRELESEIRRLRTQYPGWPGQPPRLQSGI